MKNNNNNTNKTWNWNFISANAHELPNSNQTLSCVVTNTISREI